MTTLDQRGWVVQNGDNRELLRSLPDASVDAVVTDPPYEIAMMSKRWDATGIAHDVAVWRECLRVLKPGGHLLSFGANRTYHRLACAVEDAGFEIRECIYWTFYSAFPKNLAVDRAIDRALGVDTTADERWVATPHFVTGEYKTVSQISDLVHQIQPGRRHLYQPLTEEARRYRGWGTALKPTVEPIVVARKPFKGTVAANVLEHGCGALNIDGCRVGVSGGGTKCTNRDASGQCLGHGDAGQSQSGQTVHGPDSSGGRWPTNLLLGHTSECRRLGIGRISGQAPAERIPSDSQRHARTMIGGPVRSGFGHAGPDGCEEVELWKCAPGCPVAVIDQQGGGKSNWRNRDVPNDPASRLDNFGAGQVTGEHYQDQGGPSRFFPQFQVGEEDALPDVFLCVPKASRSEREAGCEELPEVHPGIHNPHNTIKPVKLMRWLVRLVTPKGGVVLDPFAGSGTTGIAAGLEGMKFLGLEIDPGYCEVAEARLRRWWPEQPGLPGTE